MHLFTTIQLSLCVPRRNICHFAHLYST